jgi:hypothetical protein
LEGVRSRTASADASAANAAGIKFLNNMLCVGRVQL